jgi:hypothetical protein
MTATSERDRMRGAANKARHLAFGVPSEGDRQCPRCGDRKALTEFKVMLHKASGRDSYCIPCRRDVNREWAQRNRSKAVASTTAWKRANPMAARLTRYPINVADFKALLAAQGDRCAICRRVPDDPFSLCVDHDHASGKVRGLLCTACNSGLGKLGDSEEGLLRALEYLRRHREGSAS